MTHAAPSRDEPIPEPVPPAEPGLRHELSSPLTVIRCHAQLAHQRLDAWSEQASATERDRVAAHLLAIEDAVDRIVALLFPERSGEDANQGREDRY